ncbi:MAG: hypothetical protein ACO39T_09245 [Flavobacteriaceae bacterium]
MIAIGKTYKVTPKYKKTLEEIEFWQNPETKKTFSKTLIWRSGVYRITPQDEDEVNMLLAAMDHDDELCITDFSEFELDGAWDCCSEDIGFIGVWSDEEKQELENAFYDEGFFALEGMGFDTIEGAEITIYDGVDVEEVGEVDFSVESD